MARVQIYVLCLIAIHKNQKIIQGCKINKQALLQIKSGSGDSIIIEDDMVI